MSKVDDLRAARHDCNWCGTSISRQQMFCCERCRHEYNTAKGTNYDKLDFEYIAQIQRQRDVDSANRITGILGCWVPGIFFFLLMCVNPQGVMKVLSTNFYGYLVIYVVYLFITSCFWGPPADKSK